MLVEMVTKNEKLIMAAYAAATARDEEIFFDTLQFSFVWFEFEKVLSGVKRRV